MLAGDRLNFLDAETKLMPATGQVRRRRLVSGGAHSRHNPVVHRVVEVEP
jgi:hypothetical protein